MRITPAEAETLVARKSPRQAVQAPQEAALGQRKGQDSGPRPKNALARRVTARRGSGAARQRTRPEAEIVREVLRYLATVPGVVAWRSNTGAFRLRHKGRERFVRFGPVGQPDILGWKVEPWCRGASDCHIRRVARFLALEVKRAGAELRPDQAAFLQLVRDAGGLAGVVRSVDDVVALGLEPPWAPASGAGGAPPCAAARRDGFKREAQGGCSPGGSWPRGDLRRAFVEGAAWWEWERMGATIWRSDRDKAEAEAERRYPSGGPLAEHDRV